MVRDDDDDDHVFDFWVNLNNFLYFTGADRGKIGSYIFSN
jgi:hypothetical protein